MLVLLAHPPLLPVSVWDPLTRELTARGHRVQAPDLGATLRRAASGEGWWRAAARHDQDLRDREGDTAPDLLVAWSGAGALTPVLAAQRAPARVVLLDAVLPEDTGVTRPGPAVREMVAALPRTPEGRLPRWTRWWPDDVLADLLPDAVLRRELDEQTPELPADVYEHAPPSPAGWIPPERAYVRLSAAYDGDADLAQRRGWDVTRVEADHLWPLTEPARTADLLGC